jgi:hypothetical protein
MTNKKFKLRKREYWRAKDEKCERCKQSFQLNEDVVCKRSANGKVPPRYYHLKCWNGLFIEV